MGASPLGLPSPVRVRIGIAVTAGVRVAPASGCAGWVEIASFLASAAVASATPASITEVELGGASAMPASGPVGGFTCASCGDPELAADPDPDPVPVFDDEVASMTI